MPVSVLCNSDFNYINISMDVYCSNTPFILICLFSINIYRTMFDSHILFILIRLFLWSHILFILIFCFILLHLLVSVIYMSYILFIQHHIPIEYVYFVMPPRLKVGLVPHWVVDLTVIQRHIHVRPFTAVVPIRSHAAVVSLPVLDPHASCLFL